MTSSAPASSAVATPGWFASMDPRQAFWFLFKSIALPILGGIVLASATVLGTGWTVLQSQLATRDQAIATLKADVVREIGEKTDGGKLLVAVERLSSEMKGLSDVPVKLDALTKTVSAELGALRSDMSRELGGIRADLSSIRERFNTFDAKLDGVRDRMDDARGQMNVLMQRVSANAPAAPAETAGASLEFIVSGAPPDQQKTWASLLFKARDALPARAQLMPYRDGSSYYVKADEASFATLTKVGFERVEHERVEKALLPPGFYVKVPGSN